MDEPLEPRDDDAERSFVVAVDKPVGPSSHDVVRWARRAFRTREVGHAGTLDPLASGVLVLAVGEGTKLVPHLSLDDKEYDASITLGAETDTLDAEGVEVARAAIPHLAADTVTAALARFVGVTEQIAPVFSALKRGGVTLHARARRGEAIEAPARRVEAHAITLRHLEPGRIDVHLWVGKGYYVRSFARDLARALGTVGHLGALRRTRSGVFTLDRALDGSLLREAGSDEARRAQLAREAAARRLGLLDALSGLPRIELDAALERDARHGKPVRALGLEQLEEGALCALARAGRLVAIARRSGDALRVVRGFRPA